MRMRRAEQRSRARQAPARRAAAAAVPLPRRSAPRATRSAPRPDQGRNLGSAPRATWAGAHAWREGAGPAPRTRRFAGSTAGWVVWGGKGIGNTARGWHVATACGRHGASGSAARRAGRRLHGVGSTSSAARRQSACSGARSPSVIVLEITQRGRSDAGHRRMPHGSPCSMTMAARVCAGVRALSSAHVLRIASASFTVSWPVRKSSPHLPQRRRKLPLDASGSMKPKATSTKKPEKPQPTATRHSTSTGSGPKTTSGGEGLQTRLGARTTNRLRSQIISRNPSVSSAQVLIRWRVINGRLGARWRCSISARTKSSWSAWLSVRRMMSMCGVDLVSWQGRLAHPGSLPALAGAGLRAPRGGRAQKFGGGGYGRGAAYMIVHI